MDSMKTSGNRKHSGGRPQLSIENRRCVRVQPSFTLQEFKELEQRAARAGLEVSEWLRTAGLKLEIKSVPLVNRNAYAELANLASNLSKITSRIFIDGTVSKDLLFDLLKATQANVQQLRAEILGNSGHDR